MPAVVASGLPFVARSSHEDPSAGQPSAEGSSAVADLAAAAVGPVAVAVAEERCLAAREREQVFGKVSVRLLQQAYQPESPAAVLAVPAGLADLVDQAVEAGLGLGAGPAAVGVDLAVAVPEALAGPAGLVVLGDHPFGPAVACSCQDAFVAPGSGRLPSADSVPPAAAVLEVPVAAAVLVAAAAVVVALAAAVAAAEPVVPAAAAVDAAPVAVVAARAVEPSSGAVVEFAGAVPAKDDVSCRKANARILNAYGS